jgi:Prophage protein (DUF1660)
VRLAGLLCAVSGHRWAVDDESADEVVHLHCTRCGAEEIQSQDMFEAESWDRTNWLRIMRSNSITWPMNDDKD